LSILRINPPKFGGGLKFEPDAGIGQKGAFFKGLQKLLDISQIKGLGWKPNIALKDGIRNVYEWSLKGIK